MTDHIQSPALLLRSKKISRAEHSRRPGEAVIIALLFLCGFFSIFVTVAIIYELTKEALLFFPDPNVTLWGFLTGLKWQPKINQFGVVPLVTATLVTSAIAMVVAIPLGLMVAIYLSEYASQKVRGTVKPIMEILAGIPTVVYGFFALTFITPLLRGIFGSDIVQIYNMASAGLAMGILILPLIASMTEDALSAVPRSLREAGYSLGSTKIEVALKMVVPAAFSGISAAILLGISRAIGETMIVALAAGAGPNLTLNPFEAAETMTGYMVRISGGDLSYDSMDYNSIFAIGLLLFVITFILNHYQPRIVRHFREAYE